MQGKVDVVIIGAGTSGSIAGAYLAKGGLKTVVLEATEHIGGPKNFAYSKDGFRADLSHATYWGLGWNKGKGWWVEAAHQVGATITFQCLPNNAFYSMGQITKVPYCTNGKAFAGFFQKIVPMEIPEATLVGLAKVFDAAAAMPEERLWSVEMETKPAKEWIDGITDDELAKMLLGNFAGMMLCIPSEIALGEVNTKMVAGSLLTGLFGGRANMVGIVGGACDEIHQAFCNVTKEHGGEVLLRHRAKKVIIEGGMVKGVVVSTPDGDKTYEAKRVIISTEYDSYKQLLGENLPKEIESTIGQFNARRFTSLDVHFGLKRRVISPAWSYLAFISDQGQFTGLVASFPHFDPSQGAQGKQLLQFQTFKPTSEYKKRSQEEWMADMLNTCEEVFPGVKAEIEWKHAEERSQPFQYQFLPIRKIPLACPGISGLYFTGDCTESPSFVTDHAAASAMRVADAILKGKRPH